MIKKGIVLGALLLASASSQAELTVCNKYSCQPMTKYNPQEVLDAFAQVFSASSKELVFCEANEESKTCNDKPITFSGQTNLMSVQFTVPFTRILQLWPENGDVRLLLNYQIQANQYYPACSPANSSLIFSVSDRGDFLLTSPDFDCRITELGQTKIRMNFTINYLNLDKGIIGATYNSLVRGDVLGGGTGYVLMQASKQRAIKMPRPIPTDFVSRDGYNVSLDGRGSPYVRKGSDGKLVNWDWDNIKVKWNSFKEKFLKILYLEPLE